MPRTLEASCTSDYFSEFALLLQPPCGSDKTMAILAGYLDDSGTHAGSPITTVAGGVSSIPQWTRASKSWRRYLKRHGIEDFHMSEFVSGFPPYDGWSKEKQRQFLLGLVGIIKSNVRYLAGGAASEEDFRKAYAKFPNPSIKDVYHFCAVVTLPAVGTWAAQSRHRSPVALMYDQGNHLLNEYFRLIQRDFLNEDARDSYRIGTISQGNRRLVRPLQMADVIAYGVFKCKSQDRIEPYLEEAYSMLWKIKNGGLLYTQENIEKALEGVCRDLEKRAKAQAAGGTL